METERLTIFNEQGQPIGTATRQEVHQQGLWHETFHCWFISFENNQVYLYFQLRSLDKLDYPGLLDITAAGHLLAEETVEDGVREMKEEVGIEVQFDQLIPIGEVSYTLLNGSKMDNEIAHLFVYIFEGRMEDFSLQVEEVSGIVKVELEQFISFWQNSSSTTIHVEGFEVINGIHTPLVLNVSKQHFVQHGEQYYDELFTRLKSIKPCN